MRQANPFADVLPDAGTRWRLRLARLALRLEAVWPGLVWLASLVAVFVALALLELPARLPAWLHLAVLLAFVVQALVLLHRISRSKKVEWLAAARRLEVDGGLPHRPFQTLIDHPADGDGALWERHRQHVLTIIAGARLSWPRSIMAAADPWGVRAGAFLLLAVAVIGAGHDWRTKLHRALVPTVTLPRLGPDALEVWITPPAYTGLVPRLLRPGDAAVMVAKGSTVLAVLAGGWGWAHLRVGGDDVAFTRQDDDGQRVETHIQAGERLSIRQMGREVASWPLRVVADLSPAIEFTSTPEAAERGRLHMAVSASDDYGLVRLWAEFRRLGAPVNEAPLVVELPLPAGRPKQAGSSSWHDLTAHPWAGLPVLVQPLAEDFLGQRGAGEVMALTLPERPFANANARQIIELRRQITEDRIHGPGVIGLLDRFSLDPARFNDDVLVFLALRLARHALEQPDFSLSEVQDLLWNAALRIEDGDLAAAEQRLEESRRALEQGLDADVGALQMQALLDQFQAALHRYLSALAERMGPIPDDMGGGGGDAVSEQELMDMLDAMRDMAAIGAREGLKKMLRDMAGILDSLQTRMPQAPPPAATQGLRDLRDLAQKQQRLLEQSHVSSQSGGGHGGEAADRQQGIRAALDAVRRQLQQGLGQEPAALADADQAMVEAEQALRQGDWNAATAAQSQALDDLSQGLRQALEDMAAGAMGGGGIPRDPLGRPAMNGGAGASDDGSTRVPDGAEVQKARTILQELRRRAGQFDRPQAERDYLQRLLRQF